MSGEEGGAELKRERGKHLFKSVDAVRERL